MVMRRTLAGMIWVALRAIQEMIPWIGRAIRMMFWAYLMTMATLWQGIPQTTQNVADAVKEEAIRMGFSSAHIRTLHRTVRIVTGAVIVIEWIAFSFTTVFIITVIF